MRRGWKEALNEGSGEGYRELTYLGSPVLLLRAGSALIFLTEHNRGGMMDAYMIVSVQRYPIPRHSPATIYGQTSEFSHNHFSVQVLILAFDSQMLSKLIRTLRRLRKFVRVAW